MVKLRTEVNQVILGYSIFILTLILGMFVMCVAGLITGFAIGDESVLRQMIDMTTNGLIWGVIFGTLTLLPSICYLCAAIADRRKLHAPEENTASVFIGMGGLCLFVIYSSTVIALSNAFIKISNINYTVNLNSLLIAGCIIAILTAVIYVTVSFINLGTMKRICEKEELAEKEQETTKTEEIIDAEITEIKENDS